MSELTELETKIKETKKELSAKLSESILSAVRKRRDIIFKIRDSEYTVNYKEECLIEANPQANGNPRSQNVDLAPVFKQARMAELARGAH